MDKKRDSFVFRRNYFEAISAKKNLNFMMLFAHTFLKKMNQFSIQKKQNLASF